MAWAWIICGCWLLLTYLEFSDDFFPRGDGEFGFLFLPPQQEVVVREGIFSIHQEVHQMLRHLFSSNLQHQGGILDGIPLVGGH